MPHSGIKVIQKKKKKKIGREHTSKCRGDVNSRRTNRERVNRDLARFDCL